MRDGRHTIYELHDDHVAVLLAQAVTTSITPVVRMPLRGGGARRDPDRRMTDRAPRSTPRPATTTTTTTTTITGHGHGHSHGLVDRSIVRSHEGVKAVSISLGVLGVAALVQTAIFAASGSVALLADLIHNFGDALTAIPLGIAFFLRSARGEKLAGLAVVGAIFISACVALYETIERLAPSAAPLAPVGARRRRPRRLRRQRARRPRAPASRAPARQPRDGRRRQPRPRRRVRLAQRDRERRRRRARACRSPTRSSGS